jgi:hypothetical protein
MAVMIVVTAVLLQSVLWIERVSVVLLVWGRGEMVVMCVVTAVLFITVLWSERVKVVLLV